MSLHACDGFAQWSRRHVLTGAAVFGLSALSGLAFAAPEEDRNVLVVVFLRGGWDGLGACAPVDDDHYRRARPTLALRKNSAIPLTDGFALHPALTALRPLWDQGRIAVVHAVGSGDETRSHFEAMAAMERGAFREGEGDASGWIARHLLSKPGDAPLRAVALGTLLPDSLRGAPTPVLVRELSDMRLDAPPELIADLARVHTGGGPLHAAGRKTLHALEGLKRVTVSKDAPDTVFGKALAQVSALANAGLGLEVAALDMGQWDSHVGQGPWLDRMLKELGDGLAWFDRALGSARSRVTTVVMSEFGRRVAENAGLGTDHGRGTAMLVMGAGARGGNVFTRWPGLAPEDRVGPGDLKVTTDYRDVLAEVLTQRLSGDAKRVFPGAPGRALGVMA